MFSWRSDLTICSRVIGFSAASSSPASALFSISSPRVCTLAARTATGTAASAVMITETTAVATVTRTTRPVSERKKSRIGGVADAAYGPDERGRVAQLGPHLGHVHVDRAGAGVRRVAPDAGQQLLPGEDPAGPAEQVAEQLELGRGEGQRAALDGDQPAPRVERDRP